MSEALEVILNGIKNAKDEDGGELWMPASWATREGAAYEIAVSVMQAFGDSEYVLIPISHWHAAINVDLLTALESFVNETHETYPFESIPAAIAAIAKARSIT